LAAGVSWLGLELPQVSWDVHGGVQSQLQPLPPETSRHPVAQPALNSCDEPQLLSAHPARDDIIKSITSSLTTELGHSIDKPKYTK
jgi:hypothetical protein